MYRVIKNNTSQFSTFQLENGLSTIESSHIYIADKSERELLADDLFAFINEAYDELGGFRSFKDIRHFIDDSYLWYITYDGEQPSDLSQFDMKKVYVVSIFRQKYGLKMVGLARRKIARTETDRSQNAIIRRNANAAVIQHIKFINTIGWAEVSNDLEKFFQKSLSIHDIIDPYDLLDHKVFPNMRVCMDEFHYERPLRKGEKPIEKIAYGKIKF